MCVVMIKRILNNIREEEVKHLMGILCAAVSLLCCSPSWAGAIGRPDATLSKGKISVSIGVDAEEIDLVGDTYTNLEEGPVGVTRFLLVLNYGLANRLNIFAKGGAAEVYDDYDDIQIFINKGFSLDTKPIFGGGFKATLLDKKDFKLGLMAQASSYKSEQNEEAGYWNASFKVSMIEYDVALGGTYTGFNRIVPFCGVHYNKIDGDIDLVHHMGNTTTVDAEEGFSEKDSVGLFLGTDLIFNDQIALSLEGRFLNETAGALYLILSF